MGWIVKTARKNFWRVKAYCELDDLIQDGVLHYCRIVAKYPHVTSKAHLMGLFKVTYINHFNDLSKKVSRVELIPISALLRPMQSETTVWDRLIGVEDQSGDLAVRLAQAPKPVHTILQLLLTNEGCRRLRSPYRVNKDGTRQTTNDRLRRLAGVGPGIDILSMIRNTLS